MHESRFAAGSVIMVGDDVFVKNDNGSWNYLAFNSRWPAESMQALMDDASSEMVEVLHESSLLDVLEGLPSGSIVLGGDSEVAIKGDQKWSVSGSESWYGSSAVLEMLGDGFEVVRRGETV